MPAAYMKPTPEEIREALSYDNPSAKEVDIINSTIMMVDLGTLINSCHIKINDNSCLKILRLMQSFSLNFST